jgi:hypothetical protein
MNILADIIWIIHCFIVLFIILAPFSNTPAILILHAISSISLMLHWWASSDVCCLTVLESNLRGLDRKDTFLHKFIAPIYNISEYNLNNLIWTITLITFSISIYKLYNSKKVNEAFICYQNLPNDSYTFNDILKCFQSLFII